jgi:5-methylcytosine-specific restriction endonuclease McrA
LAVWRADYRRRHPQASAAARGYDKDWRELRNAHLAEEPYCRHCAQRGIERWAQTVDHIESIREAPERRLDDTNLQSLCWPCHNRKTVKSRRNSGLKGGRSRISNLAPERDRAVNFVSPTKSRDA